MLPTSPDPTPPAHALAERPGAALARFLARRGHVVMDALGTLWWRRGRFVYWSLPFELRFDVDPHHASEVLREHHALGLYHPTLDAPGEPDGLYLCPTAGYSLARVKRGRRWEVRKGQSLAELRWVDPDELLAQGLPLNLETMARHRHFLPEFGVPERWARYVAAVRDTPEVRVAGAFVGGRLASYAILCRDGRYQHALTKMTRDEDLRRHTSAALDVWLLCEAARDPTLEGVASGGLRGAEHLRSYKTSIGYALVPMLRATHLHPALGLLASRWSARATGALAAALPRVTRLRSLARTSRAAHVSVPP